MKFCTNLLFNLKYFGFKGTLINPSAVFNEVHYNYIIIIVQALKLYLNFLHH
jgi:hypothetical protein